MTRKYISVEDVAKKWMKDPEFRVAYDALEEEFALASALIKARGDADLTQEEVAAAMGTTQAFIARLESGKSLPSTRTLERFAKATHTKLRIRFEPEKSEQHTAMNPVILIPARLGSTRLPNKPLADIHGEPMIVHVWRRGVEAGIGPVWVACDDARIKEAVEAAGGQAVMTRSDHASGSDRIYEALLAIDPSGQYDVVVNLQGDVPTITPGDIRACLAALNSSGAAIATLAAEMREPRERTDPSVVKPVLAFGVGGTARALYFSRAGIPHGDGPLYHHIGIYAYRREALARFVALPPSPLELREKLEQLRALEAGMHIEVALVDTVPLGVDTPDQLKQARKLLK